MAREKRLKKQEDEEVASWLTTYSDLVTLLLTFFVMLFSMATLDAQKFEQIAYSLRSAFDFSAKGGDSFEYNSGADIIKIMDDNNPVDTSNLNVNNKTGMETGEQKLERVREELEKEIERLNLGNYVSIIEEKSILILRIDSIILFDSGKADIKESGRDALKKLGEMFRGLDNNITVQGHADDRPINTLLFPTNWELSTKRATNVVRFLIDECGIPPEKLTATGNAEFKPIRPNDTEENRQKNRRIDIVIAK